MFTLLEYQRMIAGLKLFNTPAGDELINKIDRITGPANGVQPCLQRKNDSRPAERTKIFEVHRELINDLLVIDGKNKPADVLVFVPGPGSQYLAEGLFETILTYVPAGALVLKQKRPTLFLKYETGLTVRLITRTEATRGFHFDHVFVFNREYGQ